MTKRSDISGFHRLSIEDRLKKLQEFSNLTEDEIVTLSQSSSLDLQTADKMIENVIGTISLPIGLATNFLVNGKDYLIPMAIEESSVVAAASHAAKLARSSGGFVASADEPIMIGQIQILDIPDLALAKQKVIENKEQMIQDINDCSSALIARGGGLKDIKITEIEIDGKTQLVAHLIVDVRDAMGANIVNTFAEKLAPKFEDLTNGRVLLKIISNLAIYRVARAEAIWKKETLEESFENGLKVKGEEIADGIIEAWKLAKADHFRRATHHKGIMNGIDAVLIATGNDWRAAESGVYSYSAYKMAPATTFMKNETGDLVGKIEVPLAVGLVGGATRMNPVAQIGLKILGVTNAQELAAIASAVGLANNFAALRALVTEGIQRGHMQLHATNLAIMSGAKGELIDKVAKRMTKEGNISASRAKEIMEEYENNK